MRILNTKFHDNMASGRNWCACASNGSRTTTAFGKTEEEAIDNVKARLNNAKRK